MKKHVAALFIMIVGITAISAANFDTEVYGGIGAEFYYANGFKDTRLSDYKFYGSNEGSLLLSLEDMNKTGVLITVQGGVRYELLPNVYTLGEVCLGFIDMATYALQVETGGLFFLPLRSFYTESPCGRRNKSRLL